MNAKVLSSILFLGFLVLPASVSGQDSQLKETTDSQYKVGQVWRYWTRPNEKGSTFVVLKAEKHPTLHTIIHIAITGVKIKTPDGKIIERVPHMPMTETGIESSGSRLVAESVALPAYEPAYSRWKQAFDAGNGFVYADSIAGALDELDATLNRKGSTSSESQQKVLSRRPPITQSYSAAKDRTDVMLPLAEDEGEMTLFGSLMSTRSGVFLAQAHYEYEGSSYSLQSARDTGRLVFIADKKNAYEDPPRFSVSVDDQPIFSGEAELYLSIGFDHDTKVIDQWITVRMPRDVFLKVATANNVVIKIGEKSYKPKGYQTKYLHSLAKAIQALGN
jgi:hypothetical protein